MPLGAGTNQLFVNRTADYKPIGQYGGGKGVLFSGPAGGMTSAVSGSKIGAMGGIAAPNTQLVEDQLGMSYQGAQDLFKSLGSESPEGASPDAIAQLRRKLLQNRGQGMAQY